MKRLGCIYLVSAPPSANHLHKHITVKLKNGRWGTRRAKTQQYKDWIERASTELVASHQGQKPMLLSRDHRPMMDLFCGFDYTRDCSNVIKPIEDLLKRCALVMDDRYIHRASSERALEPLQTPDYGPLQPAPGMVLICFTWQEPNGRI